MLHLHVLGDRVVTVEGAGRHEIRGSNHGLHGGEAGALLGIEQSPEDRFLFRGWQTVNADQARFQQ